MQPKVKFLTVVWGKVYIERFCSLSLPSFLASGNLPALSGCVDLEVVIMTRSDDFEYFDDHAAFKLLRKVCPVRFVGIDDLITTGVYGVTLTLAYARPIIACGADMLNIHFVFMNADFVLANGSLASLNRHIDDGRSIVLGPSFRAIAENVEPTLEKMVSNSEYVLEVEPRRLVELSLANLHATTFAKNVNQQILHSTHPNQFYWHVDENTMLGRCYLIFMLCLKPERIIDSINCYCDYSFIPELCPSGDEVVMNDSDDFFMLELQNRDQELFMLKRGRLSEKEIVRSLQEWTTFEHRRAATYDIVFHSKDIPSNIDSVKAEANCFINRITQSLGKPKSHKNHKYWVFGVEAWKSLRAENGLSTWVLELAPYAFGFIDRAMFFRMCEGGWLNSLMPTIRREKLFGPLWGLPVDSNWRDIRLLQEACNNLSIIANIGKVLVARDSQEPIERYALSHAVEVQFLGSDVEAVDSKISGSYSGILLYLKNQDLDGFIFKIEQAFLSLEPLGVLCIFIYPSFSNGNYFNSQRLLIDIGRICNNQVQFCEVKSVDGLPMVLKQSIFSKFESLYNKHYRIFGAISLFWTIPVLVAGLLFSLISNMYLIFFDSDNKHSDNFSSMLITVSRSKS